MNERRKTFGQQAGADPVVDLDAGVFQPRPISRPDPVEARRVAEEGGFTSGSTTPPKGQQQRYSTGRTVQLGVRVTQENFDYFAAMARARGISKNEFFEELFDDILRARGIRG